MTHYKGNTGDGVKSSAASDLVDKRGGTRDSGRAKGVKKPSVKKGVKKQSVMDTPEGLVRERKGPYSPSTGRGQIKGQGKGQSRRKVRG